MQPYIDYFKLYLRTIITHAYLTFTFSTRWHLRVIVDVPNFDWSTTQYMYDLV